MVDKFTMPLQTEPPLWFTFVPTTCQEAQAQANHGNQSLERLRQRGGVSLAEMIAIVNSRPWRHVGDDDAVAALLHHGSLTAMRKAVE